MSTLRDIYTKYKDILAESFNINSKKANNNIIQKQADDSIIQITFQDPVVNKFLSTCDWDEIENFESKKGMSEISFSKDELATINYRIKESNQYYFGWDAVSFPLGDSYQENESLDKSQKPFAESEIVSFKELVHFKSMTVVPAFAFKNCKNLTTVYLPPNIKKIEDCAFADCPNLTTIVMPKGGKLESIGECAFANTGLVNVIIPEGVTEIGACAFADCKNLVSVQLPSTLNKNRKGAFLFSNCPNLTSITGADFYTPTDVAFCGKMAKNKAYVDSLVNVTIWDGYNTRDEVIENIRNNTEYTEDDDNFWYCVDNDLQELYSEQCNMIPDGQYIKKLNGSRGYVETFGSIQAVFEDKLEDVEYENINIEIEDGVLIINGTEYYLYSTYDNYNWDDIDEEWDESRKIPIESFRLTDRITKNDIPILNENNKEKRIKEINL